LGVYHYWLLLDAREKKIHITRKTVPLYHLYPDQQVNVVTQDLSDDKQGKVIEIPTDVTTTTVDSIKENNYLGKPPLASISGAYAYFFQKNFLKETVFNYLHPF